MPIYEFHCADCDSTFEALLRVSAAAAAHACRHCAGSRTRRVLSTFAARTPNKTQSPQPQSRNRPGKRVELPADVPRPPVELGPPPPLPDRYVRQLKEHGHC